MLKTAQTAAPQVPVSALDFQGTVDFHLRYSLGVAPETAAVQDVYKALALTVRQNAIDAMSESRDRDTRQKSKRVHYLSMEFLVGRCTLNNLINMGLVETAGDTVAQFGYQLGDVLEAEHDPALGNGGLGRLAACFLDSMATLDIPGFGYGINYDYGLFRQSFTDGFQKESPDNWKVDGTPWLIERAEAAHIIPLYGRIFHNVDSRNEYNPSWMNWHAIIGVPYDMPVVGFGGERTNYLRLYSARASDEFDIAIFNEGDYMRALEQKMNSERISRVLYPEDSSEAGKELRLIQEYFFVACAIRDIVSEHLSQYADCRSLAEKNAIQLNDTHPALAVAELMRILVDEQRIYWDEAWDIVVRTCAYTNHTLLPEALECWPRHLLERVLPRHMQIIEEIDRRFVDTRRMEGRHDDAIAATRIIDPAHDGDVVRMANLSIIGSHSTNGVAQLHTDLLRRDLVPEFNAIWPERFNNKTNGITQRRWLRQANPRLSTLITEAIGEHWVRDLGELRRLERLSDDTGFNDGFSAVKRENKRELAEFIHERTRVRVSPDALFDVQVKRIHEYKRQLLNALNIVYQYLRITEDGHVLEAPVVHVFGGKAAPGYFMAKRIIKLINAMAVRINNDPRVGEQLKVVYIPDYRVSVAERVFPGANLSEQISTAGFEASGTGNMKFALNGALTIGTLDGANVEIREEVGDENIYIFGHTADEISHMKASGQYRPWDVYYNNDNVRRVMDAINSSMFTDGEEGLFEPIFHNLLDNGDFFCLLADFQDYADCHARVRSDFNDAFGWNRKAIMNVARVGKFSSDRTIADYARDIWNVPVRMGAAS